MGLKLTESKLFHKAIQRTLKEPQRLIKTKDFIKKCFVDLSAFLVELCVIINKPPPALPIKVDDQKQINCGMLDVARQR